MQLNVSGHHVEVTTPLREYVESKFERLQRHFDQITNTQVTLIVEKLVQKAEMKKMAKKSIAFKFQPLYDVLSSAAVFSVALLHY